MSVHYKNQNYRKLKKKCLKERTLFTDPEFPPTNLSIFLQDNKSSDIVWKRPKEIAPDPKLFVDGVSINDVLQGTLGNCWFVSACSALTHHTSLLNKVIPDQDGQEWNERYPSKYAGIFHFQFWRFGKWTDVVVDDLLPTKNGKLVFAKSKTPNEFWSALLEKAFAKLYGCYESLIGGHLADALLDLSGGVPETLDLTDAVYANTATQDAVDAKLKLFHHLKEAAINKALIAAAIKAFNTNILMVRLQNPWRGTEWNGPWADGSPEWEQVSESQKKDLGITVDEDGEFWMTWSDFCLNFTDVTICQMISCAQFSNTRYNETTFVGAWKTGPKISHFSSRAGGCSNFKATFLNNPQYLLEVREDQQDTVMLALSQKETFEEGARKRAPYLTIGMHVLQVESNRRYRLHQATTTVTHSPYANTRSALLCVKNLSRGTYILLPTTFAPGEQADYILRIYAAGDVVASVIHNSTGQTFRELRKDKPKGNKFQRKVRCVTRCRVIEVRGLEQLNDGRGIDAYFVIKCEKGKYKSRSVKNQTSVMDIETVFMRRNPDKRIKIEIWDGGSAAKFVGAAKVTAAVDNEKKRLEVPLVDKHKRPLTAALEVVVELATYDDILYL